MNKEPYLEEIVEQVISENQKVMNDVKNGTVAFNFLVGQVVRKTNGRCNIAMVEFLLQERVYRPSKKRDEITVTLVFAHETKMNILVYIDQLLHEYPTLFEARIEEPYND